MATFRKMLVSKKKRLGKHLASLRNPLGWARSLALAAASLVGVYSIQAQESLLNSLSEPLGTPVETTFFPEYQVKFTLEHDYQPYGPFASREFEAGEGEISRLTLLPPLFSVERNTDLKSMELDFLYPLWGVDRYGEEYRVHIFQIFNWAGGQNAEDQMTRRFTIFPLFMSQRSEEPDNNYWALIPFYGHVQKRMWKDEVSFVMMPLYVKTRKRDVVTRNYLFPFVHVRQGDDNLSGWQVWPLAGREHKDIGTRSDVWGDEFVSPGHTKEFYIWPIGFRQETDVGTENPQNFLGILPFYAQTRSPNRDHSVILWPFFNWADDREKKYREWGMPYPFFVFARGEGKTTDRVFPLFGFSHSDTQVRDFVLWPAWKKTLYTSPKISRERERLFFYLYSDLVEKYEESETQYRRTDAWPLFSAKMSADETYRFDMLSPFEPFFHNNKAVERNWTPAVSLWSLEENKDKGHLKESFFWNLYRHEENSKQKRWSGFFGLVEKVQDEEYGSYWRIFYSQDKRRAQEAKKRARAQKENSQSEAENP